MRPNLKMYDDMRLAARKKWYGIIISPFKSAAWNSVFYIALGYITFCAMAAQHGHNAKIDIARRVATGEIKLDEKGHVIDIGSVNKYKGL